MGLGYKQISKVICIACSEPIGEHRKRELARCLFRIQGTMVSNGIENDGSQNPERQVEQYSDEDIADARNEGHIKGFDTHIG